MRGVSLSLGQQLLTLWGAGSPLRTGAAAPLPRKRRENAKKHIHSPFCTDLQGVQGYITSTQKPCFRLSPWSLTLPNTVKRRN